MRPSVPLALLLLAALAAPGLGASDLLPASAPCEVPDVAPGAVRIDAGPTEAVRIRFTAAKALEGNVEVWFALRGSLVEPGWPAERALAAGFLETAAGEAVAIVSPQLGIYPYGIQADLAAAGLRVPVTDGPCLGAFGAIDHVALAPGAYDLVVVGAAEGGSRFAAFLPPGAQVEAVVHGPATLLSSATFPCLAKARTFASGILAEVLVGCSTPLPAGGKAYRSLVATWGPSDEHDVYWLNAQGQVQRCYKAPGWCVDTGSGAPGSWSLEVQQYLTLRHPSPRLPGGIEGYSGIFGAFAGRP
jgi:hypothetical protein